MYKSYKDLDIYKKAYKLAIEIHEMSLKLPKFEIFEDGSQIRRSSKSIKSNIVEGFGRRRYKQEFIKFLTYALASCDETVDHLDTLYDTNSLKDTEIRLPNQRPVRCLTDRTPEYLIRLKDYQEDTDRRSFDIEVEYQRNHYV